MPKKIVLKGIPASTGIVKGKVKLVLNPFESSKMKEGNILVSEMTNPLYIPAISKAKGIITDAGGLLCHAAIIARELNIPCIVGTKEATRILKDDKEIEVDGTNGIIYEIYE